MCRESGQACRGAPPPPRPPPFSPGPHRQQRVELHQQLGRGLRSVPPRVQVIAAAGGEDAHAAAGGQLGVFPGGAVRAGLCAPRHGGGVKQVGQACYAVLPRGRQPHRACAGRGRRRRQGWACAGAARCCPRVNRRAPTELGLTVWQDLAAGVWRLERHALGLCVGRAAAGGSRRRQQSAAAAARRQSWQRVLRAIFAAAQHRPCSQQHQQLARQEESGQAARFGAGRSLCGRHSVRLLRLPPAARMAHGARIGTRRVVM